MSVFKLPHALIVWTVTVSEKQPIDWQAYYTTLLHAVDHQRFEQADHIGNVEYGLWSEAFRGYEMMTQAISDDPVQSRKRLTERLAKEMVPATLKLLDISRPADPTDPYSYSNGVARTDEKSLMLSPPTRKAINQLRN